MTKIKICGISNVEAAVAAAAAGADLVGLVFAESRRQVATERARRVAEAVRGVNPSVEIVGVFVNSAADDVNRAADYSRLDSVQLSGDESWEYCRRIERPVIKVLHVTPDATARLIVEEMGKGLRQPGNNRLSFLLDAKPGKAYGGTGQRFDWKLAREVSAEYPVIVAGGLTPENVEALVRDVRPWGVDVSSGVETEGRKDAARISAFIQAVKAADGEVAVRGERR